MSTRKRRERDKEKMRRRILDAAKQLFVKEGFDNVSMRSLAARIEYSPAAIYRYFANKREILSVLREEGFARYVEGQRKSIAECPDPLTRLRTRGMQYMRFALAEPEYYHLMFGTNCEEVYLEGKWAASSVEAYENFRDTVEECVTMGHFGEVMVDTVVFALWAGVHGLAQLMCRGQVGVLKGDVELEKLMDSILDFWMRPGQDVGEALPEQKAAMP